MNRIAYGPDPHQFAHLRLPKGAGPHPVVLVIHGGYWRAIHGLDYMEPVCQALTGDGAATWSLEYRRLGNPGGGWPGTLDDVAHGAAHLATLAARYELDLARVVALGHSAGGHLALWLASAAKPLLAGVVSLAAVSDLRRAWELKLSNGVVAEFLGGSPDDEAGRYQAASPMERLPLGVPLKLFHGTADTSVPFELSRRFAAAAAGHGDDAELIPLKDSGHFEMVDPRTPEFGLVRDAVRSLVGSARE